MNRSLACPTTLVVFLAASAARATGSEPGPAERDFFTQKVRPILANHCFKCHGPDDKARKGKLRLDGREAALRGGKSGLPAVIPGKPDESELVRRVFAEEESEQMPPRAGKPLTAEQKEILKRWVASG